MCLLNIRVLALFTKAVLIFLFVALVHDHPVLLFLSSQSLLSHALACVATVSALLLVSMHLPVLLGVLVLPRPSHLSASASAILIRCFLVLSFGLEYPLSGAVVMQYTGWRHRRDAFTDATSEYFSFLSWSFLDPPPSVFLWHCVGSSLSYFSSISRTPSLLCCVLLCVRSELITSHLSLPCVVTTFLLGAQSPTCRDTTCRILDRGLCWRPHGLESGAFWMMLDQSPYEGSIASVINTC